MILLMKLDNSQRKEFGKYLLDLSKLVLLSFVIKLFEPNAPQFTLNSFLAISVGLTISVIVAIIGLYFIKE